MNLLKGSFFLKVAALVAAVVTYFYIHHEIYINDRKNTADPSYKLIRMTAKSLPIKVRLETDAPAGYRVIDKEVAVEPERVIVIGPEALLENAQTAETAIVDVSGSTRPVKKKIPLESVAGIHLAGEITPVEVTVPIEKLKEKES